MRIAELLPPVVTRGLKSARDRIVGPPTRVDLMGHRLVHRGSVVDQGIVSEIVYGGAYDLRRLRRHAEILRFYESCAKPLVIDAGANIGVATAWFALSYPKATVRAIEPHGGNFALLQKNVAGLAVTPILGALAAKPGRLHLFDPGEGDCAFRTGAAGDAAIGEVRAYTVDELIEPGETPFILKIDIEGGESGLFDSAGFERWPVIVIELHDWMLPKGGSSASFLRWHASQDRDFVFFGENVFSLCNRLL
jgi:FkbM family methyltransferase